MKLKSILFSTLAASTLLFSCSSDPDFIWSDGEYIPEASDGNGMLGFYILNEGNMGANKCTLDYFDYRSKSYIKNIYAEYNPNVPLELGDTGNDMAVFGQYLVIVVNGSHKIEVLNAYTAKREGQVNISSPRYVASDGKYVYASSYVGGNDGRGTVSKIDIESLSVIETCEVGFQPEEMVITEGKLYVVNSVNLSTSEYDNTISVIDLSTFTKVADIEAAINMNHLKIDEYKNLWATSRGNYYDIPASLVLLSKQGGEYAKVKTYDMATSNLAINKNSLYSYQVTYDANWNATNNFTVSNIDVNGIIGNPAQFIDSSVAASIDAPYCIAVQPYDGSIFITDAKNYISSGKLYCFNSQGKKQWEVNTGDIPGHIAFVPNIVNK